MASGEIILRHRMGTFVANDDHLWLIRPRGKGWTHLGTTPTKVTSLFVAPGGDQLLIRTLSGTWAWDFAAERLRTSPSQT